MMCCVEIALAGDEAQSVDPGVSAWQGQTWSLFMAMRFFVFTLSASVVQLIFFSSPYLRPSFFGCFYLVSEQDKIFTPLQHSTVYSRLNNTLKNKFIYLTVLKTGSSELDGSICSGPSEGLVEGVITGREHVWKRCGEPEWKRESEARLDNSLLL